MRYVCSVCGYIYDDAKEKTPFDELPSDWACPMCGAPKSAFVPEGSEERKVVDVKPLAADGDMKKLSPGELSALCSNLARGCEKQYKEEEAALFRQIADYFAAATPSIPSPGVEQLEELLTKDLEEGYPVTSAMAKEKGDRGTQRVCVWGEKVTMILRVLVDRYRKEGPSFLENTEIWVCSVCGFVYVGDNPPGLCPVCKVPGWKFDKIEGRKAL